MSWPVAAAAADARVEIGAAAVSLRRVASPPLRRGAAAEAARRPTAAARPWRMDIDCDDLIIIFVFVAAVKGAAGSAARAVRGVAMARGGVGGAGVSCRTAGGRSREGGLPRGRGGRHVSVGRAPPSQSPGPSHALEKLCGARDQQHVARSKVARKPIVSDREVGPSDGGRKAWR
eukprot:366415-Chlamydomonas_euryale.AAC.13